MKKSNKSRNRIKYGHVNNRIELTGNIHVTNHCIERYIQRMRLDSEDGSIELSLPEVIRRIVNEVRRSKLIKFNNGNDVRLYKGNKYVVEHDRKNNRINVVTMLITDATQRELFAENFAEPANLKMFDGKVAIIKH